VVPLPPPVPGHIVAFLGTELRVYQMLSMRRACTRLMRSALSSWSLVCASWKLPNFLHITKVICNTDMIHIHLHMCAHTYVHTYHSARTASR
jgi:hypothetical protein